MDGSSSGETVARFIESMCTLLVIKCGRISCKHAHVTLPLVHGKMSSQAANITTFEASEDKDPSLLPLVEYRQITMHCRLQRQKKKIHRTNNYPRAMRKYFAPY